MTRTRFPLVALAAGLALTGAACAWNNANDSRSATAGLPTVRADVEAHEWRLERSRSSLQVDDDNPVTLSVRAGIVSGTAPCNAYHGPITIHGAEVDIGHLATTLKACPDQTMRAEQEYLKALQAVDRVDDVSSSRLVLTGGDVRLSYKAYDAEDLLPATWHIVDVNTGQAIISVLAGTEPTVTFADGGRSSGNVTMDTGCNTARGDWKLDGNRLTIGPLATTLKACASPEGVMDQETALVHALESAHTVDIAPGELVILDARGRIALSATN